MQSLLDRQSVKSLRFSILKLYKVDPLAQLVEHNTFNVGVLGSSPKRITEKGGSSTALFIVYLMS